MARITGYDFMNLVLVFDQSLKLLIVDIEKREYEKAKLRAMDMMRVIRKLEDHCDAQRKAE